MSDNKTTFVYQGEGWRKEVECEIKDGVIIVPATTIPLPIPDTDLVRIAEREVIERAKAWKEAHSTRASENLFAAVSLLESRERLLREGK